MTEEPQYDLNLGADPVAPPATPTPEAPAPPSPAPAIPADGPPDQRVPYPRFQEVVQARRQAEADAARYKAEADNFRMKMEALAGLQRQPEVDPQEQQIREALERMYPALKQLGNIPLDKIQALLETVPQLQAQAQSSYDSLADQTISSLYNGAKEVFGGTALNPRQQDFLHKAFVSYVESDPRNTQRYVMRDTGLVPEFLNLYAAEMLGPARRQAAVAVGARVARTAASPTGGGAGGPVGTAVPATPKDEDALHDAAWTAFRGKLGG